MSKKIVISFLIVILASVATFLFILNRPKGLSTPLPKLTSQETVKKVEPSSTFINYEDSSGFSFSYPDNLSITKNEVDDNTYADLQLFSNDVSGSLNLKIADSKLKSLDDWLKTNKYASKEAPKEVKLGSLKAKEVKTADRLILGALDQGILFTIEMPLIEEVFWMKVYGKILSDFSFVAPEVVTAGSVSDVSFEGEEVIE